MKTVEIRAQAGLRNDLPADRFSPADLLVADNIEIDETGKVYRRLGVNRLLTGAFHSLWGDERASYCVKNGRLSQFVAGALRDICPVVGRRLAYQRINDKVFWTDGAATGVLSESVNQNAGMVVPQPPAVSQAAGNIPATRRLFCITHVKNGVESGASTLQSVDINGGVTFTFRSTSDTGVTHRNLYLTNEGGDLPLLVATTPVSAETLTLSELVPGSVPVRTRHMGPPPAGQLLGYYNGRLYVAAGGHLWYSQPYEHELFDLIGGYISFSSPVTIFAPVSDGVFVGSESEIVFLRGSDPSEFVREEVAPYGAVLGTERKIPTHYLGEEGVQSPTWLWASKKGICLGATGGVFKDLTGGRYQLPEASSGASLFKIRGGTPQFVTSLFA